MCHLKTPKGRNSPRMTTLFLKGRKKKTLLIKMRQYMNLTFRAQSAARSACSFSLQRRTHHKAIKVPVYVTRLIVNDHLSPSDTAFRRLEREVHLGRIAQKRCPPAERTGRHHQSRSAAQEAEGMELIGHHFLRNRRPVNNPK